MAVPAGGPPQAVVLAAVALGGAIGALARHAVGVLVAAPAAATLLVNGSGCVAIGALAAVLERRRPQPLARPLLVVGVLGGYTTLSTFAFDTWRLARDGAPVAAAAYVAATLVVTVLGVVAGDLAGRRVSRGR